MHEGLLILKKPGEAANAAIVKDQFMLCNKTVVKMINTFFTSSAQDEVNEISEAEVMRYPAF